MRNPCAFLVSSLLVAVLLRLIPEGLGGKIIGGREVAPHSRPYMVLLNTPLCAGALIAKDWVLTAAHCPLDSQSEIILGAHSRVKDESEKQIMFMKEKYPYPCYDKNTHEGDLQLVKLKRKAKINRSVAILPLPARGEDVKPKTMCQVAGWGLTNNSNRRGANRLTEVNVTVIDRRTCNDPQHYNYNPVIGLNMLCAGSLQGGKDSCNGDSGSPLICEGTFRGVTAFGLPGKCGDPRGPGVYTLLSPKHLDWIMKTMKKAV